jgi:flagellin-like protein
MQINSAKRRRAISPVLATVILIAITLIAAIAIAGFVFGLFGSFTSSARVSQLSVNVAHPTAANPLVYACAAAPGAGNYIGLSNTGTSNVNVMTISLTYGGNTYTSTQVTCPVNAGSTEYLTIAANALGGTAVAGQAYTGSVSMSNSGAVPITGTFT